MESLLPSSANLYIILALFIGLTALFHLIIFRRNLGKIGWKVADYAWLLLAVLGIVGATASARKTIAAQQELFAKLEFFNYYEQLLEVPKNYVMESCGTERTAERTHRPLNSVEAKKRQQLCRWFESVRDALPVLIDSKDVVQGLPFEESIIRLSKTEVLKRAEVLKAIKVPESNPEEGIAR